LHFYESTLYASENFTIGLVFTPKEQTSFSQGFEKLSADIGNVYSSGLVWIRSVEVLEGSGVDSPLSAADASALRAKPSSGRTPAERSALATFDGLSGRLRATVLYAQTLNSKSNAGLSLIAFQSAFGRTAAGQTGKLVWEERLSEEVEVLSARAALPIPPDTKTSGIIGGDFLANGQVFCEPGQASVSDASLHQVASLVVFNPWFDIRFISFSLVS
jgi:hypothetical protein